MKRLVTTVLVPLLAVTLLAACEKKDARKDEVLGFVRNTRASFSSFSYESSEPGSVLTGSSASKVSVRGLLEDDFRFKARVDIDESPGFEEVVLDDAFAVRFLEPRFADRFVDKGQIGKVETKTNVEGLNVLEALRTRRWVVDPSGAPPVVRGAFESKNVGKDPVFDAITALDYVENAIKESQGVELWSPDDINPTYIPDEDRFPKPEQGSDTKRFDLIRPPLPAASNTSGQSDIALPATRHFRRMAIYVKDDRIIRVMEDVDLLSKRQRDFPRYFRAMLRESSAPPEAIAQLTKTIDDMTEEQRRFGLLQLLNVGLEQFGQDPVFVRSMVLDFGDGRGSTDVVLPTDGVQGSLALLTLSSGGATQDGERGATPAAGDGAAGGTQPAGSGDGTGDGTGGDTGAEPLPQAPSPVP